MEDHHKRGGISRMNQLTQEEKSTLAKKAISERFHPTMPKATHSGILKIGDKEIECAVLKMPDGTIKRVLRTGSVMSAMGRTRGDAKSIQKSKSSGIPVFLVANNLRPFISKEICASSTPIVYKNKKNGKAIGYEYKILTDACEVYLRARDAEVLTKDQIELAKTCEMLMRAFSQIGLVSLIDEASGYQEVRDRFALQQLLDRFLRKEFAEWAKRFPASFYKEIFRLNNWKFQEISAKKPILIGKYTNDIVYSRLLPELVDELQNRNPKNEQGYRPIKHHQWLSEIGHIDLDRHISAVTALMKCCENWKEFKELLGKIYPIKSAKEILIQE